MRFELAVGETGYQCRNSHPSVRRPSLPLITNHYLALSDALSASRLPRREGSPIRVFLIDTPAIRNGANSFAINTDSRSNRHSSGPLAHTDFASRTTRPELRCLHSNLLCYSPRRYSSSSHWALASQRQRDPRVAGLMCLCPATHRSTGAFPHKIQRSTGLMGSAQRRFAPLAPDSPSGFRSPESPR